MKPTFLVKETGIKTRVTKDQTLKEDGNCVSHFFLSIVFLLIFFQYSHLTRVVEPSNEDAGDESFMQLNEVTSDNEGEMEEKHRNSYPNRRRWIEKNVPSIKDILDKYPRLGDMAKKTVLFLILNYLFNLVKFCTFKIVQIRYDFERTCSTEISVFVSRWDSIEGALVKKLEGTQFYYVRDMPVVDAGRSSCQS